MKDIKVTFLTPEERKMFKATVIHRKDDKNSKGLAGFPENVANLTEGLHAFIKTAISADVISTFLGTSAAV